MLDRLPHLHSLGHPGAGACQADLGLGRWEGTFFRSAALANNEHTKPPGPAAKAFGKRLADTGHPPSVAPQGFLALSEGGSVSGFPLQDTSSAQNRYSCGCGLFVFVAA